MSIEIYRKAQIVHKDNKFYFLLKYSSKNDAICPHQSIIDNNFKTKWLRGLYRGGSWRVIAIGTENEIQSHKIATTKWNAPTSWVYGEIHFGNRKNIALYYAKSKWKDISEFSEEQQSNINKIIDRVNMDYVIDLQNMKEGQNFEPVHNYCGKDFNIAEHNIAYMGQQYWDLDNL